MEYTHLNKAWFMWVFSFTTFTGSVTITHDVHAPVIQHPDHFEFLVQCVVGVEVEILVCMCCFGAYLYLHTAVLLVGDECIQERNAILSLWLVYELDAPCGVHVVQVF